jgi:hypothetical protein
VQQIEIYNLQNMGQTRVDERNVLNPIGLDPKNGMNCKSELCNCLLQGDTKIKILEQTWA